MEKDVVQIRCLSNNERYADLLNGIVFGGRQVVHGDDLREMDSQTGFWKAFPGKRVRKAGKKYRDLVCRVAMRVNFTIIGVENQDPYVGRQNRVKAAGFRECNRMRSRKNCVDFLE